VFWFWFHLIVQILMFSANVAWWIVTFRLTQNRFWRWVASIFFSVQILAIVSARLRVNWIEYTPKVFTVSIIVWNHFVVVAGFASLAVFLAFRVFSRFKRKKAQSTSPAPQPAGTPLQTNPLARREFIGACVAAAPALLTVGFTGLAMKQINSFRVRRAVISIPTLPRQLDGLTIAHVSDIHVGRITCGRVLRDIVNTTNNLRADLVLLTGDLINYELSDLSDAIGLVKQMHGRYGQYLIEGNHDLIEDARVFRERMKASGIPYLLHETAIADVRGHPMQFFGLRWADAMGHKLDRICRRDLNALLKQRQPDAFPIFLAHHPHAFDAAAEAGLPLTLSGHTHGGQLMANSQYGVGPVLFRYWSGLYKKGNSQLFVSNGVGNMFPVRINAPAEIVHLTLKCA
jgi:predicted MPP superfamily phosphohydrolase